MRFLRILLSAAAITFSPVVIADTALKIVTKSGVVAFVVGDEWTTLKMKTKEPVSAAAFQLPNPADDGTPDSTNLVLLIYDLTTEIGRTTFDKPVEQYGPELPVTTKMDSWTLSSQKAVKGSSSYWILDAKRTDTSESAVSVRLAWPRLAENRIGYDEEMKRLFERFLGSLKFEAGPYIPNGQEIVRRPEG